MRRRYRIGELPSRVQRLARGRLGVLGLGVRAVDGHVYLRGGRAGEEARREVGLAAVEIGRAHLVGGDVLRCLALLIVVLPLLGALGPFTPARGVDAGEELAILALVADGVELGAVRAVELQGLNTRLGGVGGVGVRNPVLIQLARVPRTGHGPGDDLIVGQLGHAICGPFFSGIAGEQLLDGVRVAADGDSVRVVGEDVVELGRVIGDHALVVDDRGVRRDHDGSVFVHVREVVLEPLELLIVDGLVVAAVAAVVVGALVDDVVERDEMRLAHVVGVVRRAEVAAIGVEGVLIALGVIVHVVVSGQCAHRAVGVFVELAQIRVEREVVAHVVTEKQQAAARVIVARHHVGDGPLAGPLDLFLVVGLRVRGDRAGLLRQRGLCRLCHREVHGLRCLAGRLKPAELELGRSLRGVVVGELSKVLVINRHLVARRLSHERGEVIANGQFVASLCIRSGDIDAVGHLNTGDAGLVAVKGGVFVDVVEHLTRQRFRIVGFPVDDLDRTLVEALVLGLPGAGQRAGGRTERTTGQALEGTLQLGGASGDG